MSKEFSPWPFYSQDEIRGASNTLKSGMVNYWTGNNVKDFEKKFASFSGVKHAIALSNGTVAIELSLRSLGVGKGDEVIVTSRTFIASVSSIVNIGAIPIFADIDRDSQNIYSDSIIKVLTNKTKAILCVHFAGWPCDMDPIMQLAKKFNLFVIEDCAQAHGAKYKGRPVGSIGHIGTWSFCQDKIITTGGEGGMVTTNSRNLWLKMWSYKDHGKNYNSISIDRKAALGFQWLHDSFGTNYRMTEFQAAIGLIQIDKMSEWNRKRNANLKTIYKAASKLPNIRIPKPKCLTCNNDDGASDGCVHGGYKCYIFVRGDSKLRDKIMREINMKHIPCFSGSCSEVYLEKAFDNSDFRPKERLPVAKELGETSLMFLIHPTLTKKEIQRTCDVLTEVAWSNYNASR